MATFPYLAIEGVIGVGKTTLARMLQDTLQADILLEVFEENPFLSQFYRDRERYAFQTQIFFLLSRYRQQHNVIPQTIAHRPLVSDYIFAKDHLFARLNLGGDELSVYENVYGALSESIPAPTLIVYLQAGIDTLMERIAIRDRPYERNMDRDYILQLHQAYETFFEQYQHAPVLAINTDGLNLVQDPEARRHVIGQIKAALQHGATQPTLPNFEAGSGLTFFNNAERRLPDFQHFHRYLDQAKQFSPDLYFNFFLLLEEIGELSTEMALLRRDQETLQTQGINPKAALNQVLSQRRPQLEAELADCLAYIIKLANYASIDLEAAYIAKMSDNLDRTWAHQREEIAE